jgi:hypothetical protein
MADVFISFRTDDTARVKPIREGFLARGLTVFWWNDIPKGAANYQAVIKEELVKAPVVVVVWTTASVHSDPVAQECSEAKLLNKLFWAVQSFLIKSALMSLITVLAVINAMGAMASFRRRTLNRTWSLQVTPRYARLIRRLSSLTVCCCASSFALASS